MYDSIAYKCYKQESLNIIVGVQYFETLTNCWFHFTDFLNDVIPCRSPPVYRRDRRDCTERRLFR